MTLARRIPSGRPADGEFADYAKADIDHVAGEDAVETLEGQARQTLARLTPVDERIASTFTYAPGKWSMKQVLGHMADDERIFAYRALGVAFFANAYLELPWVSDREEAQSEPARRTRLWERWSARKAVACVFGIEASGRVVDLRPELPLVLRW